MSIVSVESLAPSSFNDTSPPSPSLSGQSLTAQGGLLLLKQTTRVWKLIWISSSRSKCEGKMVLRSHRSECWCCPFRASPYLSVFPMKTCLGGLLGG